MQAIDLLLRETPIITNDVFSIFIQNEKERKRNSFSSREFRSAIISSLSEALELTTDRRREYSQILGTGIILGREVERPQTGDELYSYKEFIDQTLNNKQVIMELLSSSSPEDRPGMERLSSARCELQAKVWQSEANRTKNMFYIQSAITALSVGLSSALAPTSVTTSVAGANSIPKYGRRCRGIIYLYGFEYYRAGLSRKKSECNIHQNNLYQGGADPQEYIHCLEGLRDIQLNALIAVACGISIGLVERSSRQTIRSIRQSAEVTLQSTPVPPSNALIDNAPTLRASSSSYEVIPEVLVNPVASGRISYDYSSSIYPGTLKLGMEVDYFTTAYAVKKVFEESIQGRNGVIHNPVLLERGGTRKRLVLLGSETPGGKLKEISSIDFHISDYYEGNPMRVLEIGLAATKKPIGEEVD